MASVRNELLVLFLVTLLTSTNLVSSFSISKHRSERNTDLAEALAILQRQRRRVGVDEFINSQRLLEDRPLTLEDVSDWLSRSNGNNDVIPNDQSAWMPESGRFKDFDPSPEESYLPPYGSFTPPTRMKASENDIDDIFASEESEQNSGGELEKKKKEELVNPKGDAQIEKERSDAEKAEATGYTDSESDVSNDREVLNSLSDEEIRVLMKAVGKLQQRANNMASKVKKSAEIDFSNSGLSDNGVIESQPATQEELTSVFKEVEGPVSKETIIVGNKEPGQDTPQVVEHEIVSEKLPDDSTIVRERELTNLLPQVIENEIEAEKEEDEEAEEAAEEEAAAAEEVEEAETLQKPAEAVEDEVAEEIANISKDRLSPELVSKYLLMKQEKLFDTPQTGASAAKRTAKRASGFYSNNDNTVSRDDLRSLVGDIDMTNLDTQTLIQAFVVKILSLQDQIDSLKFKNRLEDLENDQLTDALNEATIGQREGSVSTEEWNSLQHAIDIEQALQDLKTKETGVVLAKTDDDDNDGDDEFKRKRGEPWKRIQDDDGDNGFDVYAGAIASRSPARDIDVDQNADIERLLKSSYLMKYDDEDSEEGDASSFGGTEEEPIASLFLSQADQCPAVQRYSNNCELADLYNLPVDFEARALCNLHEMCYACGHSLSVSQAQCDLVYRAAVASLCHQKEGCVAESEIFLKTMKLKTRYIPHVQPSCRSRCTAQFMGMF